MLMIYLSWAVYAGGLAYLAWRGQWPFALAWLVGVPLAQAIAEAGVASAVSR